METKLCRKCDTARPFSDFNKCASKPKGIQTYCRECTRETSRKHYKENSQQVRASVRRFKKLNPEMVLRYQIKKYGLSVDAFKQMMLLQNGKCALCFREPTRTRLHIDHCHTTGRVRGLLCDWCNRGIGLLKDNAEVMLRAAAYVQTR